MTTNLNATLTRRATLDEEGVELTFTVKGYANEQIAKSLSKNIPYRISLSEVGSKRSIEQNKLLWLLLHEVAEHLNQTDEETYINALELADAKYEYIACLPEASDILKEHYRAIKLMNTFEHNGKTFNQYKVFYGSSKMNTKEMTKLIDTVMQMARELDIPVDEERYL